MSPSSRENSPHTMRHALHQCPHPLAEMLATHGGLLDAIQPYWKEDNPCLGSRLTFDHGHFPLDSCLDSQLASPWPQRHVGPEMPPCHMLHVAGHCLAQTLISVQRGLSSIIKCDDSRSRCSDVAMLITLSRMSKFLLPPWWIATQTMADGPRFPWIGWMEASISLMPCLRRTGTLSS